MAELSIGQHDHDRHREKARKVFEEYEKARIESSAEEERLFKKRGEKINHKTIDIPYYKFYEKRKIFTYLNVDEYEKRIEIEFCAQGFVKNLDKIIFRKYFLSEQPNSIDEALNIYMSNEERVNKDEEFIVNVLINGDIDWYEKHKNDIKQ